MGRVSSGPNDVVVSLSTGEKGDGLDPSSAAGEDVAANPFGRIVVKPVNKQNLFLIKDMDQDFKHIVAASKVPMLKPGEYEIWRMRLKQFIQMIDLYIWEVIENGYAKHSKTTNLWKVLSSDAITTANDNV
ncbi:hypothetical protein Tco_0014678 [Tanacetum coccineum]